MQPAADNRDDYAAISKGGNHYFHSIKTVLYTENPPGCAYQIKNEPT